MKIIKNKWMISLIGLALILGSGSYASAQERGETVLLAGTGQAGYCEECSPATTSPLDHPVSIAVDVIGYAFFTDTGNNRIRKLTREGVLQNIAQIDSPVGIALDAESNIYVASSTTKSIFKIAADDYSVTTVVNGLDDPFGLAVDADHNLYVSEPSKNEVLKIAADGTRIVAVGTGSAGFSGDNGPAAAAQLNDPKGLALDTNGVLYIADAGNGRVRRVDGNGMITTLAGGGNPATGIGDGGPAIDAKLVNPQSVTVDSKGYLFIAETGQGRIRKVSPAGIIRTPVSLEASGIIRTPVSLEASGIFLDVRGHLFIADAQSNQIRKVYSEGCRGGSQSGSVGTLLPDAASLRVGDRAAFQVQLDACLEDRTFEVKEWTVDSEIGAITPEGVFTADQPGDGTIQGTLQLSGDPQAYPLSTFVSVVPFVAGDVNADGSVTIADAVMTLQIAVGLLQPDSGTLRAADRNGDGKVGIPDVTTTLRQAVGL